MRKQGSFFGQRRIAMLTVEASRISRRTFRACRDHAAADLSNALRLSAAGRPGGSAAGSASPEPVDTAPAGVPAVLRIATFLSGLLAPMLAQAAQHSRPWLSSGSPLAGAPPSTATSRCVLRCALTAYWTYDHRRQPASIRGPSHFHDEQPALSSSTPGRGAGLAASSYCRDGHSPSGVQARWRVARASDGRPAPIPSRILEKPCCDAQILSCVGIVLLDSQSAESFLWLRARTWRGRAAS